MADETVFARGTTDRLNEDAFAKNQVVDWQGLRFILSIWPDQTLIGQETHALTYLVTFIGVLMSLMIILAAGFILFTQYKAKQLAKLNQALAVEMKERQLAEAEKLRLKEAIMQNQKLQAIGTLAGGIAHNFNNLLYSMKGYVQLTRGDLPKESVGARNLGKVLQVLANAEHLVAGILSFSRAEKSEYERLDIQTVLERSIDLLRMTLPASIELVLQLSVVGVQIKGSAVQLQQVLMNIIKNGVDAMQGSGCITIKATVAKQNDPLLCRHTRLTYASYVVIQITDEGVGMDEATQQRIFEPFFTTKDVGKGTGLGLATSRSIILDHRGQLVVKSQPGKGSTFSLFIPITGGPKP